MPARISAAQFRKIMGEHAPKNGNKHHAVKTIVDGFKFDSKAEAEAYVDLKRRERAGEIRDLVVDKKQLHFDLVVKGVKVSRYTPDFRYVEVATGKTVYADKKSKYARLKRNEAYVIRKKLMKALHDIDILEL
jgi:hypothetical protein